jgi:hypothetical protein
VITNDRRSVSIEGHCQMANDGASTMRYGAHPHFTRPEDEQRALGAFLARQRVQDELERLRRQRQLGLVRVDANLWRCAGLGVEIQRQGGTR